MAESHQEMDRLDSRDSEIGDGEDKEFMPPPLEDVMNLVVFVRDRTGIHFTLENAPMTQCSSLLDLILQEQGLPPEAQDVFSLWLVSPMLELRLKKHHNPFRIVQRWDELCARYTDCSNDEIHDSEPVLMMQRDVFYRKDQETNIHNEQILCLLYHEGKYNVIEGRYVLHSEDYHTLAGIQALIHLGSFDPQQHVLADYRANLVKFYPEFMYAQSRFSMFSKNNNVPPCEEMFMLAHQRVSEELQHLASKEGLVRIYRKYLEILWSYPFYGGAFFSGVVEAKMSRLRRFILPNPDFKIRVCINSEGISVFNKIKPEYLVSVPYSQLSWEYQDLEWDGDSDPPPTLLLQFICDEQSEEAPTQQITKLMQIYSREAKLMDALIETCVKKKLELLKGEQDLDAVDGRDFGRVERKVLNKLEKLSLDTYTKDGQQLDTA